MSKYLSGLSLMFLTFSAILTPIRIETALYSLAIGVVLSIFAAITHERK